MLESGADRRQAGESFLAKPATAKAFNAAFEHYDRAVAFDRDAFPKNLSLVGMDEVGRGPLAGPLVAVCVLLSPSPPLLPFLRDSKKLSPAERESLVPRIKAAASHVGYGIVEAEEFGGEINLHHLTFLAMSRALEAAKLPKSCALLVDGKFPLPSWSGPQRAVIKGDDTSLSIAAASILAKVYRDALMLEACRTYPQYGFSRNVGYGTEEHRRAILEHGPCPLHRRNFIRTLMAEADPLMEKSTS